MSPTVSPNYLLRVVLALFGIGVIFLGLNVGLGGIETLGWQGGATDFLTVTDPALFAIRDNHIRFIGGVWLGLGLLMLAGSLAFHPLRPVLIALCALIFVGGLARLSGQSPALWFGPAIAPSLLLELVAVPLLALWLHHAERQQQTVHRAD